jgi:hypothetical protein
MHHTGSLRACRVSRNNSLWKLQKRGELPQQPLDIGDTSTVYSAVVENVFFYGSPEAGPGTLPSLNTRVVSIFLPARRH